MHVNEHGHLVSLNGILASEGFVVIYQALILGVRERGRECKITLERA